jgi:hypothetical protein
VSGATAVNAISNPSGSIMLRYAVSAVGLRPTLAPWTAGPG